ncbi:MAG TPA: carbohydrate ABC transporter permease [Aggregatilinea sp.]|jgi:multiple sugar transport system permease protein|uniref:carbohydrate ABC transporter permease n=1 Tax=Aggregatilinea sp. TaxID=2806333 RepID=UPI002C496E4B|nr:carbohydrate ABC transporter permease [Aggregatilinea sp.]HML21437.1 carbohydrate ABC transporter permease [Aggregatilinea sp.]
MTESQLSHAAAAPGAIRLHPTRWIVDLLYYAVLIVLALVMLIPFAWMLSTSLKPTEYILSVTPQFIPNPATLDSYRTLFDLMPMQRMLGNSLFVAIAGAGGQVLVSAMAAYAFARIEWRGREIVFLLYLGTMMVPSQVTLIPLFILIRQLGWVNSYQGLILPGLFSAFGTFLLRQAFLSLPRDLEEAAFIDGANHLTIFWRIILPLTRPALATLAVLSFMQYWNAYLWPLFVARQEIFMTLPVGLAKLQGGPRALTQWNVVMAGAVVTVLPILIAYLFAQKWFVRSVTLSGIKG